MIYKDEIKDHLKKLRQIKRDLLRDPKGTRMPRKKKKKRASK